MEKVKRKKERKISNLELGIKIKGQRQKEFGIKDQKLVIGKSRKQKAESRKNKDKRQKKKIIHN